MATRSQPKLLAQGKPRTLGGSTRPWRVRLYAPGAGTNKYQVYFRAPAGEGGSWKRVLRRAASEEEARKIFAQAEAALDTDKETPAGADIRAARTIRMLGEEYLTDSIERGKQPRTMEQRESRLNAHILPTIGDVPVAKWRVERSRRVMEKGSKTLFSIRDRGGEVLLIGRSIGRTRQAAHAHGAPRGWARQGCGLRPARASGHARLHQPAPNSPPAASQVLRPSSRGLWTRMPALTSSARWMGSAFERGDPRIKARHAEGFEVPGDPGHDGHPCRLRDGGNEGAVERCVLREPDRPRGSGPPTGRMAAPGRRTWAGGSRRASDAGPLLAQRRIAPWQSLLARSPRLVAARMAAAPASGSRSDHRMRIRFRCRAQGCARWCR